MLTDVDLRDIFARAAKALGVAMVDGFEVDESFKFLAGHDKDKGPAVVIYTCATNGVGAERFGQTEMSLLRGHFDGSDVGSFLYELRRGAAFILNGFVEGRGLKIVAPPVSKRRPGG
jgi:hypothetical protein